MSLSFPRVVWDDGVVLVGTNNDHHVILLQFPTKKPPKSAKGQEAHEPVISKGIIKNYVSGRQKNATAIYYIIHR